MSSDKIANLRRRREDISRRIERASKADNSYEHNDVKLRALERELERIEQEIRELGGEE